MTFVVNRIVVLKVFKSKLNENVNQKNELSKIQLYEEDEKETKEEVERDSLNCFVTTEREAVIFSVDIDQPKRLDVNTQSHIQTI